MWHLAALYSPDDLYAVVFRLRRSGGSVWCTLGADRVRYCRLRGGRARRMRQTITCFDFYIIEAKPENLIGDRAYDSDPLDQALRQDGIEMIAPHSSNASSGYNGNVVFSSGGSTTPRTSSALSSSLASLSSSGNFEIGSSLAISNETAKSIHYLPFTGP
jgi:hypothetical protein